MCGKCLVEMAVYLLVELSFALVCKDGVQPSSMLKWYFSPVHFYADTHLALHKSPRNRTIAHCLHRKELSLQWLKKLSQCLHVFH